MSTKANPIINASHLWPSVAYFFMFSAIAALYPFLSLYYQSLGLTGGQVGVLMSISPLVTIFASPLLTGAADITKRYTLILLTAILICASLISLVPMIDSFWLLLGIVLVFAVFAAPIFPLIDSATLSMLGSRKDRYGRIRIWGTIGWGIAAPIAGEIFQRHELIWMFWIYAGLMLLLLLPASRLFFDRASVRAPFWQGMRTLFTNRQWLIFLSMIFISAIGLSTHSSYLAILMEDLGAGRGLIGIALLIATIAELPIMFFSAKLLNRFRPYGLLILAMAITGIRCLLYAVAGGTGTILAIQLLHGLTYPALWIAGVTYASQNAPQGLSATAQGVFSSVLMGLGSATGNFFGGLLLGRFGVAGMFGIAGVIVLLGLLVLFPLFKRSMMGTYLDSPR